MERVGVEIERLKLSLIQESEDTASSLPDFHFAARKRRSSWVGNYLEQMEDVYHRVSIGILLKSFEELIRFPVHISFYHR